MSESHIWFSDAITIPFLIDGDRIASSANVVMFKNLGILQLRFDRRELKRFGNSSQGSVYYC